MHNTITKYNYFRRLTLTSLTASLLLLQACDKFEYSPYEIRLRDNERELNQKNINRILEQNIAEDATITFALISDTQGYYKDTETIVTHLNNLDGVQFVLHNGDITDFGLLKEFRLINERLGKLNAPLVTVIGNHDAVNNGMQLYKEMYGPYNFSFVAGHSKFIFINTNFWEFNGAAPDLNWLESELSDRDAYKQVFVLSHIPPTSSAFGEANAARYRELMNKYKVSMSIHGHNHSFETYQMEEGGTRYMNVGEADDQEFILMRVSGTNVSFERISTKAES
jgi:3',5'-cyclic-AMP phosphodiesterase